MRILHVCSNLDRHGGDASLALAELAKAQRRRGAVVIMAATFIDGADLSLAIELRRADVDVSLIGPAVGPLLQHGRLGEIVGPLVEAADVIHLHGRWQSIHRIAANAARRYGKPYFVDAGSDERHLDRQAKRDLDGVASRLSANDASHGSLPAPIDWDFEAARLGEQYGVPSLAIIANSLPPYRVALHRRIARELPAVRLHTLFTDAQGSAPWAVDLPSEIGPVDCTGATAKVRGDRIVEWLSRHRPTAVILNGYNGIDRIRVLRWCKKQQLPCWLWGDSNIRGDTIRGGKAILKSLVVRWAIGQASGVLACGSLGQAYFEKYGALPDRIDRMPYEPGYALIEQLPESAIVAVKEAYALPADRHRLVYCGRLIDIKRVDLLIDAFTAIADERPHWDCVIAGDGPLRKSLQARVPEALRRRFVWTGFVSDPARVGALLRACDVLVHPPDVEPWALVINEAAAAGLAIVASDVVGAAAELVVDGVNGFTFPAGDQDALTGSLRAVTEPGVTPALARRSADVLAAWRVHADPVAAVQRVMRHAVELRRTH